MKKLLLGLLVFGFATQLMFSQVEKLPEVYIAVNYKYLNAIDAENQDADRVVKELEEEVAFYNLKESDLFRDEYSTYYVTFYIPEGKIVAAYNKDGKIIRTFEKFKNVKLPRVVIESIASTYPNWSIVEDVYKVNYHDLSGNVKKQYKVKLTNKNKKITVKVDDKGEIL